MNQRTSNSILAMTLQKMREYAAGGPNAYLLHSECVTVLAEIERLEREAGRYQRESEKLRGEWLTLVAEAIKQAVAKPPDETPPVAAGHHCLRCGAGAEWIA